MPSHAVCTITLGVLLTMAGPHLPAGTPDPVNLSGHWHGYWASCQTGHRGRLRARFCKIDANCYEVRFSGTFFVAIPFSFKVHLRATEQQDGTVLLSGAPRLPLFGTFHFAAVATNHDFSANYWTRKDQGQFNLER